MTGVDPRTWHIYDICSFIKEKFELLLSLGMFLFERKGKLAKINQSINKRRVILQLG